MATINQKFYFKTIRKLTTMIGSMFNNINLDVYDSDSVVLKTIKVPLTYSSRQHYWAKLKEEYKSGSKRNVGNILPMISFNLESIEMDTERLLGKHNSTVFPHPTDPNLAKVQLQGVPYNFIYNVSINVKNTEDGLQLIEQILPIFSPSFNITINEIPEYNITNDIRVILESVSTDDNYTSGFEEDRLIEWTLSLRCKGMIYQPITDAAVIKNSTANIASDAALTNTVESTNVQPNPTTAAINDPYISNTTII